MNDKELAELDLAVALAEGKRGAELSEVYDTDPQQYECRHLYGTGINAVYRPTRDGAEAMRLLEKYEIAVTRWFDGVRLSRWIASATERGVRSGVVNGEGETPAIAICRAVVALKAA